MLQIFSRRQETFPSPVKAGDKSGASYLFHRKHDVEAEHIQFTPSKLNKVILELEVAAPNQGHAFL